MSLMDKFEDKLMPIASVIGQNKYLVALRDGMTLAMPLLIVGSFFTLITNFPITAWTDWLANTTLNGQSLATLLSIPSTVTVSIMAIFIVYGIGMNFAKQEGINPASGGITAIVTWFVLMPFTTSYHFLFLVFRLIGLEPVVFSLELSVLLFLFYYINTLAIKVGQLKCQMGYHQQSVNHFRI